MLKKQMDELERLSKDEFQYAAKSPLTIVLDNVRSMHNVGSVFRTCDAFLVEKIYLCGFTPTPPHREIQKTALKIALVFGNEAEGVSEETILACDGAIEIPQFGSKHSFNISVSAGIVLWDIFNKMKG